jgi:hypothetical protein
MYKTYFYDEQIRKYLLQFGDLFYGLRVRTGLREDGAPVDIPVNIIYSTTDRAAAYVIAGCEDSDTTSFSLPMMSFHMTGLSYAQTRAKSSAVTDRRTYVQVEDNLEAADEQEAIQGIRTKTRFMPAPYNMTVDLNIWAENTDQHLQILEQILMVFNPQLEIQKTDAPWDWTALTRVVLRDIALDTAIPPGDGVSFIGSTISFEVPIWVSGPMREDVNKFVAGIRHIIRDGTKVEGPLGNLTIPGLNDGEIPAGVTTEGEEIPPIGAAKTTVLASNTGVGSTLDTTWSFQASPLPFSASLGDIFIDSCPLGDDPIEILDSSNIELNASAGASVEMRRVLNASAAAPGVAESIVDITVDEEGIDSEHVFSSSIDAP